MFCACIDCEFVGLIVLVARLVCCLLGFGRLPVCEFVLGVVYWFVACGLFVMFLL